MHSFTAAEKLVGSLRERGLDPRMGVRVGAHPTRVAEIARELQNLAQLDPRAAQRAVASRDLIITGVSLEQAKAAALELQRAGAYAWIEHGRTERYAYPSEHRADSCCEWLSLVGRDLFLARGRPWDWGEMRVLVSGGHTDALLRAIDEQRAGWARAGLREVATEIELLEEISARHPDFEARLASAEEHELAELAAVYADWLQSQGDPRGEVAIAALGQSSSAAFTELLARHGPHLLGPLHRKLGDDALRWLGPSVIAAKLRHDAAHDADATAVIETLLALPVCANLRELVLDGPYAQILELGARLDRARCRSSLRTLIVNRPVDLALGGRFERLERLVLGSCGATLRLPCSMPALRRLAVGLRTPTLPLTTSFATLDAPRLTHLLLGFESKQIWESFHGPLAEQLEQLLALPSFAKLRSLTLTGGTMLDPFEADLVHALVRVPCLTSLRRIDLRRAALSRNARAALERAQRSLPPVLLGDV